MKIGLDFDDVVNEFAPALMSWHGKKFGKLVKTENILKWDWGLYWGISREEATKRVDTFHEEHKLEDIPPAKNAINSLNELMNKHEVIIVTGRPIRFKSRVRDWLSNHLKKEIEIIHAGEWHKGQAASKAQICTELKIPILLEDAPETALDCANHGIKVLLFNKPWNQSVSHENIIRVKDWNEAMKAIKDIEKLK